MGSTGFLKCVGIVSGNPSQLCSLMRKVCRGAEEAGRHPQIYRFFMPVIPESINQGVCGVREATLH